MGVTFLGLEKRRMVVPMVSASSFVTEMTIEVAVFWARVSGLGWRNRAEEMVMSVAK
jgi:hypothetical protein